MDLSRKFVSEAELDKKRQQRQEEWEKVRKPDDPKGNNPINYVFQGNYSIDFIHVCVSVNKCTCMYRHVGIYLCKYLCVYRCVPVSIQRPYLTLDGFIERTCSPLKTAHLCHRQRPLRKSMTLVLSSSGYRSRKTRSRKSLRSSLNSVSCFRFC